MTNNKEKITQTAKQIVDLLSKNHHIETTSVKVIPCAAYISYFLEVVNDDSKGMKVSEIEIDIALVTAACGVVRLTKKGKYLIIEIPREDRGKIALSYFIEEYKKSGLNYELPIPLGLDNENKPRFADLSHMRNLLMAGTTGSGKSIFIHSAICMLLKTIPLDAFKLFLADVKRVELLQYKNLPNLYTEILVDSRKIVDGLKLLVEEKKRRYDLLRRGESFPYLVVILDTFSDMMCGYKEEFENLIVELAQTGPLAKMVFILSDSRPSVDVFTSSIKSQFPTRITGNTASVIDSRVVIESPNGTKLLGLGDMLYLPPDSGELIRVQAPYISEKEIDEIVINHSLHIKNMSIDLSKRAKERDEMRLKKMSERLTLEEAQNIVTIWGKHLEYSGGLRFLFNINIPESFLPYPIILIQGALNKMEAYYHNLKMYDKVKLLEETEALLMSYTKDEEAIQEAKVNFNNKKWIDAYLPILKDMQKTQVLDGFLIDSKLWKMSKSRIDELEK